MNVNICKVTIYCKTLYKSDGHPVRFWQIHSCQIVFPTILFGTILCLTLHLDQKVLYVWYPLCFCFNLFSLFPVLVQLLSEYYTYMVLRVLCQFPESPSSPRLVEFLEFFYYSSRLFHTFEIEDTDNLPFKAKHTYCFFLFPKLKNQRFPAFNE